MLSVLESLFDNGELLIAGIDRTAQATNLQALAETKGSVLRDSSAESVIAVRRCLMRAEADWRMQMPGDPPDFCPDAAMAAAAVFTAICRAVVFRESELAQTVHSIKTAGLPAGDASAENDPSLHYSVDLVLRFMPQLVQRASRISPSDPLLGVLRQVLRPWPLSSVGVTISTIAGQSHEELSHPDLVPVALRHPSLWRLYIDRIISAGDVSRLQHPEVRDAVAATIGPFDFLAPQLAQELTRQQTD